MKSAKRPTLAMIACLLITAAAAFAHHSFAMFDLTKRVTLTGGTVTNFEWTNPHCYIEIDVPDDSGVVKHWSIEMGSPSILQQSGWKFSTLKKGDKPALIVNPLRSGMAGGFLVKATLADGRELGNGPAQRPQ